MSEETQGRQRKRRRLWTVLAVLGLLLAFLLVPPLVNIARYKSRITHLVSASLGRPVRLSSVEARLLPRPGFVLTDLTVDEDPAFGVEPVLHATTVTASIRLLSLWRGRLEIGLISVDEASLNLVRTPEGRWNFDPLIHSAASKAQAAADGQGRPVRLPYLEATNSRINFKNGVEKLPFSLVDADLSFWQASPSEWRIKLRGNPARTDVSLQLADTGTLRLEATVRQAPQLRQMPVHLDLDWRDAQLGQLSRLATGADPGWRGDLRGEIHLDGTPEAMLVKSRLRATGVHRAEFTPADPLDFDANCNLKAHLLSWSAEELNCDTQLGKGHFRLTGAVGGEGNPMALTAELDRIPVAAGLDALRTLRSGIASGLEASGTASGKMTYSTAAAEPAPVPKKARQARAHAEAQGPLSGSVMIGDFQLSGAGLTEPVRIPKILLEPAPALSGQPQALAASASIATGAPTPIAVTARIALPGYQVAVRGQASMVRARELAHLAGLFHAGDLDQLAGDPVQIDLSANGPWMPVPGAARDSLSGTVTLRNANWKADYLVNHIEISQATLHLAGGEFRWDPITFSYGPVKGTATVTLPAGCAPAHPCVPHFEVQLGAVDAAVLQTAFLGAHEPGTMLSTLIERLRPTVAPAWPQMEGTVKADSLVLGPVTLHEPAATIHTLASGAEIAAFEAGLLGGRVHGFGSFQAAATPKDKPVYTMEGQFDKLGAQALGQLLGQRWSGGTLDASSKLEVAGFMADDLAATAKGTLHFDWQHGAIAGLPTAVPAALAHFDRWSGDWELGSGAATLKANTARRGAATFTAQAAVPMALPPKLTFIVPKAAAKK